RRPYGTALLPGPRDRCRVPESALHEQAEPGGPQRRRWDLPQRRQALAPEPPTEQRRLCRLDQDGRTPIATTLVVVSGPPRSGKTALAHTFAGASVVTVMC